MGEIDKIIETLSPLEIKVVPFLNESFTLIKEKTSLDEVSLIRALRFLENKGLLKLKTEKKKVIGLGTNGVYYKKNHLPERKLISVLETKNFLSFDDAKKISKLSDNEFKVSLGILKDKALIEIKNGKISLTASKEEISKKTFEEKLIELLPADENKLEDELKLALENLKRRKEIVEVNEAATISFELTDVGKKIAGKKIELNFIEEITPEVIKNWKKTNKIRKYDIYSKAPKLHGGKKHFVSCAIEKGREIWLEMGFKEMWGNKAVTSFWNFDALFQPQDHPARDMHDTFFIKDTTGKLPSKELVSKIKKAHEIGVDGSVGWQETWQESEAKKVLLRTHTTCLSVQTLASLKNPENERGKYFAIGKCFRNETLDWSHGFEFNQTEGIVIDANANFKHLLGYLKEFYLRMGFEDVKFYPSYFPYTEPSVEVYVFHKTKKVWIEIGGAGIFRPEVLIPLIDKYIPVLAWGPGFDRVLMDSYQIGDLRELYENDIKKLREKKVMIR